MTFIATIAAILNGTAIGVSVAAMQQDIRAGISSVYGVAFVAASLVCTALIASVGGVVTTLPIVVIATAASYVLFAQRFDLFQIEIWDERTREKEAVK